jgi:hypothetical protein
MGVLEIMSMKTVGQGTHTLPPHYYLGEITCFSPSPAVQRFRFDTAEQFEEEVLKWTPLDRLVLDIAALGDRENAKYGNLILFINAGRAFVRLLQNQDFVASDPALRARSGSSATFVDESGEVFQVPLQNTISKTQALAALHFWLSTLTKTPALWWESE